MSKACRRRVCRAALSIGATLLAWSVVTVPGVAAAAPPDDSPTMVVVTGGGRSTGDRVRVVTDSVEWFVDQPSRSTGTMSPKELAQRWSDYEFDENPPTASVTGTDLDVRLRLRAAPTATGRSITFEAAAVGGDLPRGDLGRVSVFLEAPSLLFVQQAASGTYESSADGASTLTLRDVAPQTVYFSDRPDRISGTIGTDVFAGLQTVFVPDDAPNAAVVLSEPESDEQDVAIVELTDPHYDPGSATFTYTVTLVDAVPHGLASWQDAADDALPASFGRVSLFIDDASPDECAGNYLDGPAYIRVTVEDDDTGKPLSGAVVDGYETSDHDEPDQTATTDDTGVVTLSVDPSNILVQLYELISVTHPDYSVGFQQQVVACAQTTVDVLARL